MTKRNNGNAKKIAKIVQKVAQAQAMAPGFHLPPYNPTLVYRNVFRFRATANIGTYVSGTQITFWNLGDIVNMCADAAGVSPYQVYNGRVKINRVEIWGTTTSQAADNECWVDYSGTTTGQGGQSLRTADNALGTSGVSHVRTRPSRMSAASFWQPSNGSGTAFSLYAVAGSIIEVDLSFTGREDGLAIACQNVGAGLLQGGVYMRGLDGLKAGTSNFVPMAFVAS